MTQLQASNLIYNNALKCGHFSSSFGAKKTSFISYKQKRSQISTLLINSNYKTLEPINYQRESKHKNRFKIEDSEIIAENPSTKNCHTKKVVVLLNPNSGHGLSSQIFWSKIHPILQNAGFEMEIIETSHAGQAQNIISNINLNLYPDGIICVGGDGIINEVLNGLYNRNDLNKNNINNNKLISVPIGIIPTGSDNSLAWTVLGIKDPVSAAMNIVEGGCTSVDVFAVKWINSGLVHFGLTAAYFGFLSDVLELSEKYRKRFGPLRYFIAGIMKFLSLPKYTFEVEYLPTSGKTTGEDQWVKRRGNFVGLLVCNHQCKTVQGLNSQVIAPRSVHNDGRMDLLLVNGNGRWRLLVFYIALQFCKHLMLPFVEYVKVKSVKIGPVGETQKGCGIDGELLCDNGEIRCSLVPKQLKLLGYNL